MKNVVAKKYLGQHFLHDNNIAQKIVDSLNYNYDTIIEVGPGMGVLTKKILDKKPNNFKVIEIDNESIDYLTNEFPFFAENIINDDFLKLDFSSFTNKDIAVIGNFPYNISTQIMFKILDNKEQVKECVGMFQKEVARRIACPPGSKEYGIISVLIQTWYNVEYLFNVSKGVFAPPPKVESGVIRLIRNDRVDLECNEKLFVNVVKTAFNQRRKTLRNSLKSLTNNIPLIYAEKRPEQLKVEQFIEISNSINI